MPRKNEIKFNILINDLRNYIHTAKTHLDKIKAKGLNQEQTIIEFLSENFDDISQKSDTCALLFLLIRIGESVKYIKDGASSRNIVDPLGTNNLEIIRLISFQLRTFINKIRNILGTTTTYSNTFSNFNSINMFMNSLNTLTLAQTKDQLPSLYEQIGRELNDLIDREGHGHEFSAIFKNFSYNMNLCIIDCQNSLFRDESKKICEKIYNEKELGGKFLADLRNMIVHQLAYELFLRKNLNETYNGIFNSISRKKDSEHILDSKMNQLFNILDKILNYIDTNQNIIQQHKFSAVYEAGSPPNNKNPIPYTVAGKNSAVILKNWVLDNDKLLQEFQSTQDEAQKNIFIYASLLNLVIISNMIKDIPYLEYFIGSSSCLPSKIPSIRDDANKLQHDLTLKESEIFLNYKDNFSTWSTEVIKTCDKIMRFEIKRHSSWLDNISKVGIGIIIGGGMGFAYYNRHFLFACTEEIGNQAIDLASTSMVNFKP